MNNGNKLSIVDPTTGAEIATVGGKTKRAHDPERVKRERKRLETELERCKQGWENDRAKTAVASSTDNLDAITDHWNNQYQAVAMGIDKSTEPVDVKLDAFSEWVKDTLAFEERQRIYNTPLKNVVDLTPWEFKSVGVCQMGTVWVCDKCAICIADEGVVLVMLRPMTVPLDQWADRNMLRPTAWYNAFELADLTLGELFTLLKTLRYEKINALPEGLMPLTRGDVALKTEPAAH